MTRGIIALDLDGTVVHRGLTIYRRDRLALSRAVEAGFTPVVATGRRPETARRFSRDLGLSRFPVVACDGALILGPDGEVWSGRALPGEVVRRTAELCEQHGVACGFAAAECQYIQPGRQQLRLIPRLWNRGALRSPGRLRRALWDLAARRIVTGRFDPLRAPPIYKVDLFGPGAAEARAWLLPEAPGAQETMPLGPLELVAEGVDKASGVELLIGRMGLQWKDVVAIGNDWNDLALIRRAGYGVAMGDAPKPVRDAADHVTLSVREGGVAEAVTRYLAHVGAGG